MTRLILASASAARQEMLKSAGFAFDVHAAEIDEEALLRVQHEQGAGAEHIATVLAAQKAIKISMNFPGALVIGADQVLECEGKMLQKAKTADLARGHLKMLRGKTHSLISAVALAKDGGIVWSYAGKADLTMHDFDDAFLERYCARAGDVLTRCVGAYALEGLGAQLFERIEGDYFTVLGLPLLALIRELRIYGAGL